MLCLLVGTVSAEVKTSVKEGNVINGHVLEKYKEVGMPYATVLIIETGAGTVTDDEGYFRFKNLRAGDYTLRVQSVGFSTMTKKVTVSDDYAVDIHFMMEEETIMTDEVVVSANRNATDRKVAPVVVNVMSNKLFEMVNSTDLAKTLNYQSGLRVENNCQNCGFSQVRINGLEGPYSQILINSRPVMSALSGVYGLEQIPTNMIERVEVVRGGGSALFGANAVGGTINIITKDPVNNSFQVNSTISNMNAKSWEENVSANASLVAPDNTYGMALYGSFRNRDHYDADDDGFSEVGDLQSNTFGLRGYYRPTQFSRLSLEYHTTNEFRRGGNEFDKQPHETEITEQTKHIINSGGLTYDLSFREYRHKVSIYGSAQHTKRDSYYGTNKDPHAYGHTTDLTALGGATYVGNMDKCLFAPATFTGGLEFQYNSLNDTVPGHERGTSQAVRVYSGYAQNEWKLDHFTILAGFRLDKHNMVDNVIFSPRINGLWKPSDKFQARLTWSTGFRAPQAYDEDLHVAAVGGDIMIVRKGPGLKPERSNSVSGSIDWTANFGHFQSNLLVEGFFTALNDVFYLENLGYDDAVHAVIQERRNGDGARVYGANIDYKIAHGREAQLQLGFTLQQSRYVKPLSWSEDDAVAPTKHMLRTPNYYGYFTFTSAPVRNFDFSISGVYTGKMWVPHFAGFIQQDRLERSDDFMDVNLKLNYTFVLNEHMKLQLNAGVQNIFNAYQSDLDRGVDRDSKYVYGPSQPRTYFFGIKFFN